MSWVPAQEPVLGDKRSCDVLDLIIIPRMRDLGDGFSVRGALPHGRRQMVGCSSSPGKAVSAISTRETDWAVF